MVPRTTLGTGAEEPNMGRNRSRGRLWGGALRVALGISWSRRAKRLLRCAGSGTGTASISRLV